MLATMRNAFSARTLGSLTLIGGALIVLGACSDDPPAKDPSTTKTDDRSATTPAASSSSASSTDPKASATASTAGGKNEISCKGKPAVGKPASSFGINTVQPGTKLSVGTGKVTLVDFWATWCEPCKKSFPKYQDLYVKYKASGLEIVAVSVDDDNKDIQNFIKTYGAKFPVGWDEGHKIAECYQPASMPSAFIIGKDGVIKNVHAGYHDGEEKEIEKEIKALL